MGRVAILALFCKCAASAQQVRGMVLALLLLLAGRLLRDRPRLPAAQAGLLLARGLGLVVQVLGAAPSFERKVSCAAQSPLVGVSVAHAMVFWFFVSALFDDDFRWRAGHAAAWLFAFAVGTGDGRRREAKCRRSGQRNGPRKRYRNG